MEDKGWVKLHRQILDNIFLMHDPTAFMVFVKLLLLVSRTKGEYATGRRKFSELLEMNPNTLYSVLVRLETQHLINITSNRQYSIISICNWAKYQSGVNNNDTNVATTRQQRGNTITRKKKEEVIREYVNFAELEPEIGEFVKMRQAMRKPVTARALELIVKRLKEIYPNDIAKQKACLEQSTVRSWQTVYALKDTEDKKQPNGKYATWL